MKLFPISKIKNWHQQTGKHIPSKIWNWAKTDHFSFFAVLVSFLISFLLPCFLPWFRTTEWGFATFKLWGIVIGAGGIFYVLRSLDTANTENGQKTYHKLYWEWMKVFLYCFRKPKKLILNASSTASLCCCSSATATCSSKIPKTMEEKFEFLMKETKRIEEKFDASLNETKKTIDDLRTDLSTRISSLEHSVQKIDQDQKKRSFFDYRILMSGLILSFLSMCITNLPDKIYGHIGFTIQESKNVPKP